jgi:hypothetical protein
VRVRFQESEQHPLLFPAWLAIVLTMQLVPW